MSIRGKVIDILAEYDIHKQEVGNLDKTISSIRAMLDEKDTEIARLKEDISFATFQDIWHKNESLKAEVGENKKLLDGHRRASEIDSMHRDSLTARIRELEEEKKQNFILLEKKAVLYYTNQIYQLRTAHAELVEVAREIVKDNKREVEEWGCCLQDMWDNVCWIKERSRDDCVNGDKYKTREDCPYWVCKKYNKQYLSDEVLAKLESIVKGK